MQRWRRVPVASRVTRLWQFLFRRQPPAPSPADGVSARVLGAPDASETQQKKAVLHHLLTRLNEQERTALVLFEIEGYSGDQIAVMQGVPVTQVWARIYRARTKLRTWLNSAEKQLRQSA